MGCIILCSGIESSVLSDVGEKISEIHQLHDLSDKGIIRHYFDYRTNGALHFRAVSQDRNAFFLNDLRLPSGYALTGVKFNTADRGENNEIKGFSIGIIGVPFDYDTGKLDLTPENKLIYGSPRLDPETELPLKPVSSITMNPYEPHNPNSPRYTYVNLQQTTIDDDFGQTTLPFFDALPLELDPPSPLGGVGLFHKGFNDRAGFIALRLYSINYLDFVTDFINEYEQDPIKIWNV